MELAELKEIMRESGIVGAGGAGFPSYAKLDKRADTLILNCAECEPLLRLHRQLLERRAREILEALCIVADTVGAERVIVAVKPSYKKTVAAVEACLPSFPAAKIHFLPEIYPAGDEVVAVYETTGRVVPPGGLPIMVGVTVFNVETVWNISRALTERRPVTEKLLTVAGEVREPVTVRVPVGITVGEAVRLAGGALTEDCAYLLGGPMTGNPISPYACITKTSNAVLVLPERHCVIQKRRAKPSVDMKRAMSVCCQCRMCTDLCPRYLLGHPIEPHSFMRSATSGTTRRTEDFLNTMFCSQCGLCEMYACGQELNPRTLIGRCKSGLRSRGVPVPEAEAAGVSEERAHRGVPMSRLIARLGLRQYDRPAPLKEETASAEEVQIPLRQHIGAPAVPVVQRGDRVEAGQKIGAAQENALSLPVHASIGGTVTEVTDSYIRIRA